MMTSTQLSSHESKEDTILIGPAQSGGNNESVDELFD